ncbi:probable endoglucanase [Phialocephala subalpina]|uniref:Glucanase n=1 Tax=Phialocephala subalpina TaxID=576137 RepID=A0A1L7X0H9_9HELO|nr:probable endoglucanase [Phialocephala subalpina]
MVQILVLTALAAVLPLITAQQIGTQTPNVNPSLPTWKCTTAGGCIQQNTSVVIDWNYHWIHTVNGSASCTTSTGVNSTLCPTEAVCAQNCAIEGVDYASAGVTTSGNALTLHQYVQSNGVTSNASPRVYLLGADGNYEMLQLLGQELRFDVDVSTLVCGENGALYLSEMLATGGRSQYNPGGASYGSGYCDAQCPVQNWINGTLNTGNEGACCNEMDIWEANANATALTPHPCEGDTCDKSGCGFNPYAMGNTSYYGNGGTVDTLKPITVITQFYTTDGTTTGTLSEIRRLYIQNGKVIKNAVSTSGLDSITASWCSSSDATAASLGGLTTMGQSLGRGMVLIFSIWNDNGQYMNWLDSGSSGPCNASEGNPTLIESKTPGTYTTFSNIRWGDIGSTFDQGTGGGSGSSSSSSSGSSSSRATSVTSITSVRSATTTTASSRAATTTTASNGGTAGHWSQCGGVGWAGATVCATGYTCQAQNPYYSQCL